MQEKGSQPIETHLHHSPAARNSCPDANSVKPNYALAQIGIGIKDAIQGERAIREINKKFTTLFVTTKLGYS
jgi:hypothetical protein